MPSWRQCHLSFVWRGGRGIFSSEPHQEKTRGSCSTATADSYGFTALNNADSKSSTGSGSIIAPDPETCKLSVLNQICTKPFAGSWCIRHQHRGQFRTNQKTATTSGWWIIQASGRSTGSKETKGHCQVPENIKVLPPWLFYLLILLVLSSCIVWLFYLLVL